MIYEHRIYQILPGMWNQFIQRFGEGPVKVIEKHGGNLIGVWMTVIGPGPEVVWIMGHEDMAQRDKFWDAVYQDPDFQKYHQTHEVGAMEIKILQPMSYSPLK